MMAVNPLSPAGFADYLELLRILDEREAEALIVGGQAVNFWAEVFEAEEPELRQYRPFTSADLDLHRPDLAAKRLLRARAGSVETDRDPFGKAFTLVSHTFLIQGKAGAVLAVDDLKTVPGLRPDELRKGALIVEFSGVRLRVLNPIACLKAKLHNVGAIDQRGRQDEKHVRILIPCVRGFIRRLVTEAQTSGNCRPALNALQQLLLCTSGRKITSVARAHGFALLQTVPLAALRRSRHPKLISFVAKRLPGWQQSLGSSGIP
jgi:hypothetical protein